MISSKRVAAVCALLIVSTLANPFEKANWAQRVSDEILSTTKAKARREWNLPRGQERRVEVENEEDFVEKDFGRLLTNELELIEPKNIVRLDGAAGAGGETRIITSISPLSIENDEMVTVSYYSSSPDHGDWVGAYSPPDVDISTTVPVKYAWMDHDPKYITTKAGQVRFNLTNLRQGVKFYFMTNKLSKPIVANVSAHTLTFKTPNAPLRPRVVATGDPDVFLVLWSSFDSTQPVLKWRSTPTGVYTAVVAASTDSVKQEELCGYPARTTGFFDTGLIHTATLKGMKALAGASVYYTFGDAATNVFSSREYQLRVPPLAGTQPKGRPTTVVLYDDLGRGSNDDAYTWNHYGEPAFNTSRSVGALVQKGLIDAIYHGGDISYAVGYEAVWDFFMDMIAPMASGTLYLTTVGNHESDWPGTSTYYTGTDSGGECGVAALKYLPQPKPIDLKQPWAKPWWSYDVGLIHFVGMSTEHEYAVGSEQYKFLEQDLRNVDRTKTPWIIFGGHRAMYLNSDYGGKIDSDIVVSDRLIAIIEPLIFKYKVNLAFWGHNHVVQRQSAVYQKKVVQASAPRVEAGNVVHHFSNPQATVHMVIGTGGAKLTYNAVMDPAQRPGWNELVMHEWGYALVATHNASYLQWTWINCMNDTIMDRVVITQDAAQLQQPWPCPQGSTCLSPDSSSSQPSAGLSAVGKAAVAAGVVGGFLVCTVAVLFLRRYLKSIEARSFSEPKSSSVITTFADNEIRSPEPVRISSSFEVSATVSALHEQLALAANDEESADEPPIAAPVPKSSPKRRL